MSGLKTIKYRDLSLTALPSGGTLVTACDSCGSIGSKPRDLLQIPAYYSGRFTARVPLLEVLSCRADPIVVVNTVSCEMDPTGLEIIRGIQDELVSANVNLEVLTGSTEENFPTAMTALGVTVIGYCPTQPDFHVRADDLVYCIGKPKVGAEINLDMDCEIASYQELFWLQQLSGIREIIPTGSKGILYELDHAAKFYGLCFKATNCLELDLEKSTGPATCLIAIVSPQLSRQLDGVEKCTYLGKFGKKQYIDSPRI